MEIINNFNKAYKEKIDFYERYARVTKELCETLLMDKEIPAIVTSRAKTKASARDKAVKRRQEANYETSEGVFEDLVDLAGVRIALFFPDQEAEVDEMLKGFFKPHHDHKMPREQDGKYIAPQDNSTETKEQNYEKRFGDYRGHHYHISVPEESRPHRERLDYRVEIQLVTVISSAWSQVEHDIVYKNITGKPSMDERRILDIINGLTGIGEQLLKQLYSVHKSRREGETVEFADAYELGAYMRKWISLQNGSQDRRPINFGSVQGFFTFLHLQKIKLRTPKDLKSVLDDLSSEILERRDDFEKFNNYDESLSVYVMRKIMEKKANEIDYIEEEIPAPRALQIVASTILWLDELFRGAGWETTLLENSPNKHKTNLKWLLLMEDINVGATSIWADQVSPSKGEKKKIKELFYWLKDHTDQHFVHFAFNLSRLGMLKDAKDAPQLRTIGSKLDYLWLLEF